MELTRRAILLFSATLVACSTAPKAPSTEQLIADDYSLAIAYLKEYIPRAMNQNKMVGLSVALIDDQRVVWSEGFGYADKSADKPANAKTLYRAGSVSKIFTATAVMLLAEAGKLNIDAPLSTYVPEFKLKSRFDSTSPITLRNTLSHHAGIPSDIIDGMWAKNPDSYKSVSSRLNDYFATYPPNTVFSYSNAGYSLAGHAIENVSGVRYSDYMHQSILTPLGMSSSNFSMNTQHANMSKAYSRGKETVELPLRDIPAGGLVTNVVDLAQIVKMVHAGGTGHTPILKPESLKEMLSVQHYDTPYEIESRNTVGWFHWPGVLDDKFLAIGHTGQTIAHSAYLVSIPKLKLGVVLLSNSASMAGELDKIGQTIFDVAYPVKTRSDLDQIEKINRTPIPGKVTTFDGIFSSEAGLIDIKAKSNAYKVSALGRKFALAPDNSGQHKLKLKLFGFIPIAPKELREVNFQVRDVNGKKFIVAETPSGRQLVATEVSVDNRTDTWDKRIGNYELLNPLDTAIKDFNVEGAELGYANEVYYLKLKTSTVNVKMPLIIINDSEAVLQGYGRGLGETILAKDDDTLVHSGLLFKLTE